MKITKALAIELLDPVTSGKAIIRLEKEGYSREEVVKLIDDACILAVKALKRNLIPNLNESEEKTEK